ncbi:MAG: hypothetical protein JXR50_08445, partial [Prolixibacteraceae bacterium]|nr:hypothetical protein [Prolixibacteraceae bacterium]MBN2649754.1 hypothetical protein [Prolixibacteraceae bacterium]
VSEITETSATSGGNITSDGGAEITARGVCWNTTGNPTINDSKNNDGSEIGSFISELDYLESNTTYYVRAYATNSQGTAYGEQVSFITTDNTSKIVYGSFTDPRDEHAYKTVVIGEQTWMAENLAYDVGDGCWAYNNDESNVATYGRLYTLKVAKTACPSGWYLPTDNEWKKLEMSIGMSQSEADDIRHRGTNEGTKLKATWGWNNNGNGTDELGFSALPGGYGTTADFHYIGSDSFWWGGAKSGGNNGWYRCIYSSGTKVVRNYILDEYGLSVRCITETSPSVISEDITTINKTTAYAGGNITSDGGSQISSRGVCWNTTGNPTIIDDKTIDGTGAGIYAAHLTGLSANTIYYVRAYATNSIGTAYGNTVSFTTLKETSSIEYGSFTDSRDVQTYKTVVIGGQTWMAENLAYDVGNGCWAYNNDESNVITYGRLYTLEAAKAACPSGWHLPTDDEWKQLEMVIGMSQIEADNSGSRGTNEGTKLKATSGWNNNGNGNDDLYFSALPGGFLNLSFRNIGDDGRWWSATKDDSYHAWYRFMDYDNTSIGRHLGNRTYGFSVRCIKD